MQPIEQILENMKANINPQSVLKLKTIAEQRNINQLPLWKIRSQTRVMFKMGKYQAYILAFSGIFLLPFTMYQKYVEDNSRLTKISIFTPFAITVCLAPMYFFNKYTKTLLRSISYQLKSNTFQIVKFSGMKSVIKPTLLNLKLTQKGRVKTIAVKNTNGKEEVSQIQGIGQWHNIELFKHIVNNSDL